MRALWIKISTILLLVAFATLPVLAQDQEEKSTLIKFVEKQLSSENMQIRLNGLEGSLSSNVSLDSITIADKKGIWLKVTKPKLVWNRSALLGGRVEVTSLVAERIEYPRTAGIDESLPTPEATSFKLPELPVSVVIEKLDVPEVIIGEPVFGLAAKTSIKGGIKLVDGALDLDLAIKRLDGPGGAFDAVAQYSNETQKLNLDIKLEEPQDGIVANLLNLERRPPVSLEIKGNAPLSDLLVTLDFNVNRQPILNGELLLAKADDSTNIKFNLDGPLASILPENQRDFFGRNSQLNGEAMIAANGSVTLKKFNIDSGALTGQATAQQTADGFLRALNADFELKPQGRSRLTLPSPDSDMSLSGGRLSVRYDAQDQRKWDARITAADFKRDTIEIASVDLGANGTVDGWDNTANRTVTFTVSGLLDGLNANDAGINEALGPNIKLDSDGVWRSNQPVQVQNFRINGETLDLSADGEIADAGFNGTIKLDANRLAAFSSLTGRNLKGRTSLQTRGKLFPISGGFDLVLNGTTNDLNIGEPQIDPVLAEQTTLIGAVARDDNGLTFRNFRIANRAFQTTLDGNLKTDGANLEAMARVQDIGSLTERGSGAAQVTAKVVGNQKPYDVNLNIEMRQGRLSDRSVDNLILRFDGRSDLESVDGKLSSSGSLDDKPVELTGVIKASEKLISLKGFTGKIGGAQVRGDAERQSNGTLQADLVIEADDIRDLAALALQDASGQINGTLTLQADDGKQNGKANLSLSQFQYQQNRVGAGDVQARLKDLFGKPSVDAKLNASDVSALGIELRSINGNVSTLSDTTLFDVDANLVQNDGRVVTSGRLVQRDGRMLIDLDRLILNSNITAARLSEPTRIIVEDGSAKLSNAILTIGSGSVTINGLAGQQLDVNVGLNAVPLSIINAVRPDLAAGGIVSGRAQILGRTTNPEVSFNVTGNRITIRDLSSRGVAPVTFEADGSFADNTVRLNSARVNNSQNINAIASGVIPLSGGGLSLTAQGTAPLSLAQDQLSSRGATVNGTARFDVTLRGSLANPSADGSINIQGASLTDPLSNLRLTNLNVTASLDGDRITLRQARGSLSGGGTVSANGTILLQGAFPSDITIALRSARYTDGQTFNTRASGNLRLSGNLLANPLLSGAITLEKTEITVPENFANDRDLLRVKHVRPSAKVRQTLARLSRATPVTKPTARPSVIQLDIRVDAPNQIFVRGRGLDAELGGSIRLRGSVTNVEPIGRFDLRRGRLSILGQRIDLDSGTITLVGDLDPIIDIQARTDAGDVSAFIRLQGPVSDPEVTFTSQPELPQDEVLALIIFGRGVGDLSPAQLVRLASIANELTGGNSPGLVESLRRSTGLDDLDVVQDAEGNAAVRAGKYINDRVYLGVQAGSKSQATINLDVTDNVIVRGAVTSEGEGSVGIFLEKDY